MKHTIEFTSDELEMLNTALNQAIVHYDRRVSDEGLRDSVIKANRAFQEKTRKLWFMVLTAQKSERANA